METPHTPLAPVIDIFTGQKIEALSKSPEQRLADIQARLSEQGRLEDMDPLTRARAMADVMIAEEVDARTLSSIIDSNRPTGPDVA